ncbi:ethanolamine ammonia-lyase subunit EutC [Agrobacterium rhizogenes]|nr:hypothetical protein DXT98_11315 [Agrobacterium sp. ICMP 7243]MQB30403.1 hypothetical protein [Rhizobium rhizogenes]NTF52587.1 ethanolamine ammonia-lyase subunit EutC [Rhizobium rhizogenes]NTF65596.1 ethanolamine ammonia-lyase subunit EutC [Rhizobium rhizogenes]NTF72298.1 ethanolamine ammonia-lyase subunit EutC [Rhizobium rhizogenes]
MHYGLAGKSTVHSFGWSNSCDRYAKASRGCFASSQTIGWLDAAQARVAIADQIGEALRPKISIMLIGERPGLSASDSLGAYITIGPQTGNRDLTRNCVSNIRDGGLAIPAAADTITRLIRDIINSAISGVVWIGSERRRT